ncbi:MAG: twin-arginine translocase subunit TatC [Gammaproteobacteria bacterium]
MPPGDPAGAPDDVEMPLLAHIVELRNRLLRALGAILIAILILVPQASRIYALVAQPLIERLPTGATMIATEVASTFIAPFKLTAVVAVFLTMPYLLYQAWAFVAPGLYRHERRFGMPLLISSVALFYCGAAFAYYVVFPVVFTFFTAVAPPGVTVMTDISHYLDFVLAMFLAFGVVFEIPVAIVLLVRTGIVQPAQLVRSRPYVIVGAFVVAAVLTPPDVLSQLMMALPMWALYEVGIVLARIVAPRRAELPAADGG